MTKKILIIDDEKEICKSLKGLLSDEGYLPSIAYTPQEALSLLEQETPHIILLDVWFGKGSWDGVHFLDRLKKICPLIPIIMISGHGTLEMAVRALKKGAHDFIEKPINIEKLLSSVKNAIDISHFRRSHSAIRPPSQKWALPLDAKEKKAAKSNGCLLILGENGTYKNLLAQELHTQSSRNSAPVIHFNCVTLNHLSEEDIWGTEQDSSSPVPGLFEQAQGGTVVLHHIYALSLPLQKKLTQVLQSGASWRMGATEPFPLNVRFITTAPPSFAMAPPENYNRDFYDRVTVFPIEISPLREQRNNLATWSTFFLKDLSQDMGISELSLDHEAFSALKGYDWPGNMRELYHVLARACTLCTDHVITSQHLPLKRVSQSLHLFSLPLQEARAHFEYEYLKFQLASVEGSISRAALAVGMERTALHRKIKILEDRLVSKSLPEPFPETKKTLSSAS